MVAQKNGWPEAYGMPPNVPKSFSGLNADSKKEKDLLNWTDTYQGQTRYIVLPDHVLHNRVAIVEKEIKGIKKNQSSIHIEINRLLKKNLSKPLGVIVEPDADGFIARTPDFPIYGFGDDIIEAIDALKAEIESLYYDLMEDDNFTKDWLSVKKILTILVI
jgi:hypothetical protein